MSWIHESTTNEIIFAVIVVAFGVVVAWLGNLLIGRVMAIFTRKTKTNLDDLMVAAVKRPLALFIVSQAIFSGLSNIQRLDQWQDYINKAWIAVVMALAVITINRVVSALLTWYGQEIATKTKTNLDERLMPLARRLSGSVIYAIGLLVILGQLNVSISPLLAGLGIGGLAIAFALQPTIANVFAGTYVISDGSISVGDFIEITGGPSGWVDTIGWRSTSLRAPNNNMVIIPNSKLADSIITNYQTPTPDVNVLVECGVSYESDLAKVERTALEVADEVVQQVPGLNQEFKPVLRFRKFGDSNIEFITVLQAKTRNDQFLLTHEFIKRLHARFAKEGIEINYPVRKLVFAQQPSSGANNQQFFAPAAKGDKVHTAPEEGPHDSM